LTQDTTSYIEQILRKFGIDLGLPKN